jgi:hypothetical protein
VEEGIASFSLFYLVDGHFLRPLNLRLLRRLAPGDIGEDQLSEEGGSTFGDNVLGVRWLLPLLLSRLKERLNRFLLLLVLGAVAFGRVGRGRCGAGGRSLLLAETRQTPLVVATLMLSMTRPSSSPCKRFGKNTRR